MGFFQSLPSNYSTPFNGLSDQTVTNTTTESTILPPALPGAGSMVLAPNWLAPGRSCRIIVSGLYSTATVVGNITFRVYLGSVVVATGTISSLLALASNQEWGMNVTISCRSGGPTGSVQASGSIWFQTALATRNFQGISPASAVTIDTTVPMAPNVTLQWASALSANIMTTKVATMELLQP